MQEIFQHFEVNRESRWPILSRLVLISLALHVAAAASVLYVPGVRDSVNIAALLSRTRYVDRAYQKTQVGEDVQMIELAKFHYPPGYFASEAAAPVALAPAVDPFSPRVISEARNQVEPSPTPTPTPEPSPSPSPVPSVSPETTAVANANTNEPKKDVSDTAKVEKELDKIATENSVVRPSENEVNTRPLKDWLKRANDLKEKGQLDLSSSVEITIAANLSTQCKLIDPKVIQKSGDVRLVDVAKDMVAAIGDSGMLSFLRDPKKVSDVNEVRCDEIPLEMTIKLNQEEIAAKVESQADSPARAEEMAKGYSGLLAIGQLLKRGRDEELLYKSTKVTSEDKRILVNFSMPRQAASEMLKRQLPSS
jgi:hypothetical protein